MKLPIKAEIKELPDKTIFIRIEYPNWSIRSLLKYILFKRVDYSEYVKYYYKPKQSEKAKVKKKKKHYCAISGKVQYTEQISKALAKENKFVKLRAYRCEFCNDWHLTHKKDKMRMH
jgi:hypothetical protein